MENQPATGRQWFRLASIARLESLQQSTQAPAPAAAPDTLGPRPAQPAPPTTPVVRPQTPSPPPPAQIPPAPQQPQIPPPQIPPVPPQPQIPPPATTNGPPAVAAAPKAPSRSLTPPQPLKVIRQATPTPPASPRIRQQQPSTTTPNLYPEPEPPKPSPVPQPKTVSMQEGKGNGNMTKAIGYSSAESQVNGQSQVNTKALPPSPRRETTSNATSAAKKKDDDGKMKVITMAGENTGAYMELGSPYRSHQHLDRKQHHQVKEVESGSDEGKMWDKKKGKGRKTATDAKPMAAIVNSNVQSVNNSILFSSSCTEQSPGVHIALNSHRRIKEAIGDHHHLQ